MSTKLNSNFPLTSRGRQKQFGLVNKNINAQIKSGADLAIVDTKALVKLDVIASPIKQIKEEMVSTEADGTKTVTTADVQQTSISPDQHDHSPYMDNHQNKEKSKQSPTGSIGHR